MALSNPATHCAPATAMNAKSRHDPENLCTKSKGAILIWSRPNPTLWEAGRPGAFHLSYGTTPLL